MALNDNDLFFINDSTDSNKAKSVKLSTLKTNILTGGSSDTYVEIAGDNMTGDLTLGTDKIKLGIDGSAEFAGDITVGTVNQSNGLGNGVVIHDYGQVDTWPAASNDANCFTVIPRDSDSTTVQIQANGTITAKGYSMAFLAQL